MSLFPPLFKAVERHVKNCNYPLPRGSMVSKTDGRSGSAGSRCKKSPFITTVLLTKAQTSRLEKGKYFHLLTGSQQNANEMCKMPNTDFNKENSSRLCCFCFPAQKDDAAVKSGARRIRLVQNKNLFFI